MDYLSPSKPSVGLASNRFLGAKPATNDFGDYIASDAGHAIGDLARIGIAAETPRRVTSTDLKAQMEMEQERRKQEARAQIADRIRGVTKENALDVLFDTIPIASHAGIDTKEVYDAITGAASSRGAGETVMGRIRDRGAISPGTRFTPEGEVAREGEVRSQTLADQATKLIEERGKEGRAFDNRVKLKSVELGNAKSLADYTASLKTPKEPAAPGVNQQDDLRKAVYSKMLDQLGVTPDQEKAGEMSVDPTVVAAAVSRASELMGGPDGVPAAAAIDRATEETTKLSPAAPETKGFLATIGLPRKSKPTATKKDADPLGLFSGR